jgi:hypothetical protein
MKIFLISGSSFWIRSIKRNLKRELNIDSFLASLDYIHDERIGTSPNDKSWNNRILSLFIEISRYLEKSKPEELRNSVAFLDGGFYEGGLKELSPLKDPPTLAQLAAMLVLAFPDVFWIFLTTRENLDDNNHILYWMSDINKALDKTIYEPIFDADGLRNKIKKTMKQNPDYGNTVSFIQDRKEDNIAAAIDEEEAYAYLHGYLAYKLGFRCFLINSENKMDLFKNNEISRDMNILPKAKLIFEDIYLNFPDKSKGTHFSNLHERDSVFKKLKSAENRIFVTVGHKNVRWDKENRAYIRSLRSAPKKIKIVYKPSGGIYNLLEKSGLLTDYRKRLQQKWELAGPNKNSDIDSSVIHSAPGRLLLLAEKLIDRAENIYSQSSTVPDCIHGATLALEALDLLGYRTPTTSLEAIALRHQLEVKAECMFYGVEYNIDVKNRFKEIEGEVSSVARWFHPSVRKRSALNARMGIITEVMGIFRQCGQFDEEQACLRHLRKLNRTWYFLNNPWLKVIQPIRAYIETLVGSFPLFILALLFWPSFFGVLSFKLGAEFNNISRFSFSDQLSNAFFTFFGLQPVNFPVNGPAKILTILIIFGGFMHLGIFISYLYNLITRK